MKKIVLSLALIVASLAGWAGEEILYFSAPQASRAVAALNRQDELMIYCGYEDELPTYVLVNEVWAEQVTSSFYEIWLYGFDAYTGEEVYMPIDLGCIYLMHNNHIYSAAQYLRFRYSRPCPTFAWAMPQYNVFVRVTHPAMYYYTYHYDIHRYGWHYCDHPEMHYHPYYCRHPWAPHPVPPCYTPGHEMPCYRMIDNPGVGQGHYEYIPSKSTTNFTCRGSYTPVKNNPQSRAGNRITSNRSNNTVTTTDRVSGRSTTTTAPSRTGEVSNSRSTSTNTGNSRATGTATTGSSRATGTATTGSSRATGTATTGSSRATGTTTTGSSRATGTTTTGNSRATGTTTTGSSRTASTTSTSSNGRASATANNTNSRAAGATTSTNSRATGTTTTSTNSRSRSTDTDRQQTTRR